MFQFSWFLSLIVLLALLSVCDAGKVLILSDSGNQESSKALQEAVKATGAEITSELVSASDFNTKIKSLFNALDDEIVFQSIYVLSTAGKLASNWSAKMLVDYVQRGGNLFIALTGKLVASGSEELRSLFNQFGLEALSSASLKGAGRLQWSHLHALNFKRSDLQLKSVEQANGFRLFNEAKSESTFNPLIHPVLQLAPGSAFCAAKGICQSSTQNIAVMAALESRKGSRFMALGSGEIISLLRGSDELAQMTQWLQGSRNVRRISKFAHELVQEKKAEDEESPRNRGVTELGSTIYRVGDEISIEMCLEEFETSQWKPIKSLASESPREWQYELKMMNVQVRRSFDTVDAETGCFRGQLQLPQTPAVYTLQMHHNRPGWRLLQAQERLLIRPHRHNEYPRFLRIAMPYYVSWMGLMAASYFILLPLLLRKLK